MNEEESDIYGLLSLEVERLLLLISLVSDSYFFSIDFFSHSICSMRFLLFLSVSSNFSFSSSMYSFFNLSSSLLR